VLILDGRAIGDSTRIIAAVEERGHTRRCIRKTRRNAGARSSSKSSSTRNWDRRSAAALFYPVVRPPQFPYPTMADSDLPDALREFVRPLVQRPGGEWIAEI
jgi:hypothetical protein